MGFFFLYGYGAPLGGPSGRRSSAISYIIRSWSNHLKAKRKRQDVAIQFNTSYYVYRFCDCGSTSYDVTHHVPEQSTVKCNVPFSKIYNIILEKKSSKGQTLLLSSTREHEIM